MSGDIVLGIRLKYDGKDVSGGVEINRADFRRMAVAVRDAGNEIAGASTHAASKLRSISDQLEFAKRSALSYLSITRGADAARWILDQASATQQLEGRLKVATASATEYARASAGVFEVANRWGAAVDQTAGAFARLNPVVGQMGGNAGITLKMLDGMAASLRLSGATAAETSAVLLQFAQAMGSGRVGGDEFRSMMENAEPMMRAVAQQLGKTTGELRQMAEEGRLTSSVFANALLPAVDKLKSQAEQIPLGISQAWQVLENNLKRDFGREFSEQSNAVGSAIKGVSDHSAEAAAAVHALADGMVVLAEAGAVAAAGAGGAWIAKQGQAAAASAQAFFAMRAARMADAEAAVAEAVTKAAAAQSALPPLLAEKAMLEQMAVFGPQRARVEREIAGAKLASAAATQELTAAEARLTAERTASNVAAHAGTAATTAAGAAMTALGGPIGLVTAALTAGAAWWAIWGQNAKAAGEDAEAGVDQALKALSDKRAVATTGNAYAPVIAAERTALAQLREERSRYWQENNTELAKVQRELGRMDAEIARREQKLTRLETESAKGADSGPGGLSAGGEWGKLTESYKWREKLITKYGEDAVNLTNAYAGRLAKAIAEGMPTEKIVAEYNAASRAMEEEHRRALESLPDAKEAKARADAVADAKIRAAESSSKRVLEVLKREHEQYRISTEQFVRSTAEAKVKSISAQLDAMREKLAAATKESERIPLREKIEELTAALAAIPGETAAAFEDAASKTRDLLAEMAVDAGKSLTPLEQAGAQFAKKYSEKIQKAVADGNQEVLDAAAQVWANVANQAQFDTAKASFAELTAQMQAELEAVRLEAERDGGTLGALRAEQQAEKIRTKFIPALREARAEMERTAGASPINGKAVADAGREIRRVAEEVSPFWRDFLRDMHTGVTTDLMRRVGTDGQSYGKAFAGSVQSYFKTAALKLPVQLVGDLVVSGAKGLLGVGGGNAGQGASLLNSANSAYNFFSSGKLFQSSSAWAEQAGMSMMNNSFNLSGQAADTMFNAGKSIYESAQTIGQAANVFSYASAIYQASQGNWGSAVGTAIGQYVGGPIGAFVGSKIGGLFDGDGDAERSGNWVGRLGQRGESTRNRWFSGGEMNASLTAFGEAVAESEKAIIKNLMLSSEQVAKIDAELAKLAGKEYRFGMEHTDWTKSQADEQIVADRFKAIATALGMTIEQLAAEVAVSADSLRAAYDNVVMTDAEKLAVKTASVREQFVALGVEMPTTVEAYRAQVEAAAAAGDGSKALYRKLMALAPAFVDVTRSAEQAVVGVEAASDAMRSAADIAAERARLQDELDALTMTSAQLTAKQRDAIAEGNRTLFDSIKARREEIAASEAAAEAARRIADERATLQQEYDQLTMTSAQLLEKQRAALAQTNLELFDAIQAEKDRAAAAQAAAEALQATVGRIQAIAGEMSSVGAFRTGLQGARYNVVSHMTGFDARAYWTDQVGSLRTALGKATSTSSLLDVGGQLQDAIANRLQAETDAIAKARDERIAALQAEQSAAQSAASAMQQAFAQLRDAAAGMIVGADSPLSPEAKLAAAREQYRTAYSRANAGDAASAQALQAAGQAYVSLAKDYYASGSPFAAIFSEVQGGLASLGGRAAAYDPASVAQSYQAQIASVTARYADDVKAAQKQALEQFKTLDASMVKWQEKLQSSMEEEILHESHSADSLDGILKAVSGMDERIGAIVASALDRVANANSESSKALIAASNTGNQILADRLAGLDRRLSQIESNGALQGMR